MNELGEIVERYRFVVDLDQDGDDDLLLSGGPETFGNAGGGFYCYLNEDSSYHYIGIIDAHPKAVSLEHQYCLSRIWVYLRGSATGGVLGYHELRDGRLSELQFIEITLDPTGNSIGNKIYTTIFQPPHLLTAEISTTEGNGVIWGPLPF